MECECLFHKELELGLRLTAEMEKILGRERLEQKMTTYVGKMLVVAPKTRWISTEMFWSIVSSCLQLLCNTTRSAFYFLKASLLDDQ